MAGQIKNEIPKIEVLLNNAGILKSKISVNWDGLDIRIVVNYLACYVLINALLRLLKKLETARINNLGYASQNTDLK